MKAKPKLRTYMRFKTKLEPEPYLMERCEPLVVKRKRWAMARFRTGGSDLRVETGRCEGTAWAERTCLVCGSGEVEDEVHFLLDCEKYYFLRQSMAADLIATVGREVLTCNREYVLDTMLGEYKYGDRKAMYDVVSTFVVAAMDARKTILAVGSGGS